MKGTYCRMIHKIEVIEKYKYVIFLFSSRNKWKYL